MFGLTFEKLFLVAVIAAVLIGPHRLPELARRAGVLLRQLRAFVESSRTQAEHDLGVPLDRTRWEAMDLRQYDPRRIVREAFDDGATTAHVPRPDAAATDTAEAEGAEPAPRLANPSASGRGARYLVSGSAAHPRRILIPGAADEAAAAEPATEVAADIAAEPESASPLEPALTPAAAPASARAGSGVTP